MKNSLTEIEQHLAWEASKQGLLVFEQTGEAGWPRWLVVGASNAHGFISLVPPRREGHATAVAAPPLTRENRAPGHFCRQQERRGELHQRVRIH